LAKSLATSRKPRELPEKSTFNRDLTPTSRTELLVYNGGRSTDNKTLYLEKSTMKRALLFVTVFSMLAAGSARLALAHCEVPCGIYADQRRFEEMLEDTATIAKAIASIGEITEGLSEGPNATDINQSVRWVTTKESHATNTQHIIAQYFMTQRLKPGTDGYTEKLVAAHAVMVASMKCKQAADPATAEALKKSIYAFYKAYEGKEPDFDHDH
jgi:nickel superoxide dismutase